MSCDIILNKTGIYTGGDTVSGKVVCTFETKEEIKGITCQLRRTELTQWKDQSIRFDGTFNVIYKTISFETEPCMDPGVNEYPFSFVLPTDVPSSYRHTYGSIQYYVSGVVQRPQLDDYTKEVELRVLTQISLNSGQLIFLRNQTEEVNSNCCFAEPPSILWAAIERNILVVGDEVRIKVGVENRYRKRSSSVVVELISHYQYIARRPITKYKNINNVIAKVKDTSGVAIDTDKIYLFKLKIPKSTFIPNFQGCSLFEHWCSLRVVVEFPYPYEHFKLETSIENIKLCHSSSLVSTQAVVPPPRQAVIPVAQAPSGMYPPSRNRAPYPLGIPTGHPIPVRNTLDPCTVPSASNEASNRSSRISNNSSRPPSSGISANWHRQAESDSEQERNSEPPPPSYDEVMRQIMADKKNS